MKGSNSNNTKIRVDVNLTNVISKMDSCYYQEGLTSGDNSDLPCNIKFQLLTES